MAGPDNNNNNNNFSLRSLNDYISNKSITPSPIGVGSNIPSTQPSGADTQFGRVNPSYGIGSLLSDMGKSFLQGYDQTQFTADYKDYSDAQKNEIVTRGLIKELDDKYGSVTDPALKEEYYSKRDQLTHQHDVAVADIGSALDDLGTNAEESRKNEPSLTYLKKSYDVNSGVNSGAWDKFIYSAPQATGSSISLMGQQMAGTALSSTALEYIAPFTGPAAPFIIGAGVITNIAASRWQETKSEVGGTYQQNVQQLTSEYINNYNAQDAVTSGKIPPMTVSTLPQEVKDSIVLQSRKGGYQQIISNMALAIPDIVIEGLSLPTIAAKLGNRMVVASEDIAEKWGFKGLAKNINSARTTMGDLITPISDLIKTNKLTRVAGLTGRMYLRGESEGFEEGLQQAAAERSQDEGTGNKTGLYQDKGIIGNLLTDSFDTITSMGLSPIGELNLGGKYSKDPEFKQSEYAGFMMGAFMGVPGQVAKQATANTKIGDLIFGASAKSNTVLEDFFKYREVVKDLRTNGALIKDPDTTVSSTIMDKYFKEGNVHHLINGIKALTETLDSDGKPLMTKEEAKQAVDHIKDSYKIYQDLVEHVDNMSPSFGTSKSKFNETKNLLVTKILNTVLQHQNNKLEHTNLTNKSDSLTADWNIDNQFTGTTAILNSKSGHLKTMMNNLLESYNKDIANNPALADLSHYQMIKKSINTLQDKLKTIEKQKENILKDVDTFNSTRTDSESKISKEEVENATVTLEHSNVIKKLISAEVRLESSQEEMKKISGINTYKKALAYRDELDNKIESDNDVFDKVIAEELKKKNKPFYEQHKDKQVHYESEKDGTRVGRLQYSDETGELYVQSAEKAYLVNDHSKVTPIENTKQPAPETDKSTSGTENTNSNPEPKSNVNEEAPSEPAEPSEKDYKDEDEDPSPARRNILRALFMTQGNSKKKTREQIIWTKALDRLVLTPQSKYKLALVSDKHIKDIYPDIIPSYHSTKGIIYCILMDGDLPMTVDGIPVYSTIHDIYNFHTRMEGNLGDAITPKMLLSYYTNQTNLDEILSTVPEDKREETKIEIVQSLINQLTELRQQVFESDVPLYVNITDRSKGVLKKDSVWGPILNRIVKERNDIDSTDIQVIVDTHKEKGNPIFIKGHKRTSSPGLVMIYDAKTDSIYPVRIATLDNMKLVDHVLNLIATSIKKDNNEHSKYKKELENLIMVGEQSNKAYQLVFNYDTRELLFGDTGKLSFDVFIEAFKDPGKVDMSRFDDLITFLKTKRINVSNELLNSNNTFVDPVTGQSFKSYKRWLLDSLNPDNTPRTNRVPITSNIHPMSDDESQYENRGLVYNPTPYIRKSNQDIETDDEVAQNLVSFSYQPIESKSVTEPTIIHEAHAETEESNENDVPNKPTFGIFDGSPEDLAEATRNPEDVNMLFDSEAPIVTKEQLDREEDWYKKNLPQLHPFLTRLKTIINGNASGVFTSDGKTLIYEFGNVGSTYHEAFHNVTRLYLSDAEIKRLFDSYRKAYNKETLSDKKIEEELADLFKEFVMSDGKLLIKGHKDRSSNPIINFFKNILNFIKFYLGLEKQSGYYIHEIFKNINTGEYAHKDIVYNSFNKDDRYSALNLPQAVLKEFMDSFNCLLFNHLFINGKRIDPNMVNGITDNEIRQAYSDIYNLDIPGNTQKHTLTLMNAYRELWVKGNSKLQPSDYKGTIDDWNKLTEAQKLESSSNYNKAKVFQTIMKNYGTFVTMHWNSLKKFGFSKTIDELTDKQNDTINGDAAYGKDQVPYINSAETSTKDNMVPVIKIMFASIMDGYNKTTINNDGSVSSKFVIYKNQFGLPKPAEGTKAIDFVQDKLSGISNYEDMIYTLSRLSKIKPYLGQIIQMLGSSLSSPRSVTANIETIILQNQFFKQFAKTKHQYMVMDWNGNLINANSITTYATTKLKWRAYARDSKLNGRSAYILKSGKFILDQSLFKNKLTFLDSIVDEKFQLDNIDHILQALNYLGIVMDRQNENEYDKNEKKDIINAFNSIYEHVLGKEYIKDIFTDNVIENSLIKLSEINAVTDIVANELQHVRSDGTTVYDITTNSYITYLFDKINKFGVDSVPQINTLDNKNSYLLELLKLDPTAVRIVQLEGDRIINETNKGQLAKDAKTGEYLRILLNAGLGVGNKKDSSIHPFMRLSDTSLSYALSIKFPKLSNTPELFRNILRGYLKDELYAIRQARKGEGKFIEFYGATLNSKDPFIIFGNILTDSTVKDDLLGSVKSIDSLIDTHQEKINTMIDEYINSQANKNLTDFINFRILYKRQGVDKYYNKRQYSFKGGNEQSNNVINRESIIKILGLNSDANVDYLSNEDVNALIKEFTMRDFVSKVEQSKLIFGNLAGFKTGDENKRFGPFRSTHDITPNDKSLNKWLSHNVVEGNQKHDGFLRFIVIKDQNAIENQLIEAIKRVNKIFDKETVSAYSTIKSGDSQGWMAIPFIKTFLIRQGLWNSKTMEEDYQRMLVSKEPNTTSNFIGALKPVGIGPQVNQDGNQSLHNVLLKLSIMPLFPAMFKNDDGTTNRAIKAIYDTQMHTGADLMIMGSGVKFGIRYPNGKKLYMYNEKGEFNINPDTVKDHIQMLSWDYFGHQVNVHPESHKTVSDGIQIRKIIQSNLAGRSVTINGVKTSGDELIDKFNRLYDFRAKRAFSDLMNDLGIKEKDDNFIISDVQMMFKTLEKAMNTSGISLDAISSLKKQLLSNYKYIDVLTSKDRISAIMMSIIDKNVLRGRTLGDMKVIGSPLGFETQMKTFNEVKDALTVDSTPLKFYSSMGEGYPTNAMEVYLGDNLEGMFREGMSVDPKLLRCLGYRIPLQDLASVEFIKIKGFLPKGMSNMVIVPEGIVTKTNADFDVDKLTLLYFNSITIDNKETYVDTKWDDDDIDRIWNSMEPESRGKDYNKFKTDIKLKQANNELLELYADILRAPENFNRLISPIKSPSDSNSLLKKAYENIKPYSNVKQEGIEKSNLFEFGTNWRLDRSYWISGMGRASTVLQSQSHVLAQIAKLYVNKTINFKQYNTHEDTDKVSLAGTYTKGTKTLISDIMSELISAFIEIAKFNVIDKLNLSSDLEPIWSYLIRAGVSIRDIAFFLQQPSILAYIEQTTANNANFLLDSRITNNVILTTLLDKYPTNNFLSNAYTYNAHDLEQLLKYKNGNTDVTIDGVKINDTLYNNYQHQILKDFLKYKATATELGKLIRATSYDNTRLKKSPDRVQMFLYRLPELFKNTSLRNINNYVTKTYINTYANILNHIPGLYKSMFLTNDSQFTTSLDYTFQQIGKSKVGLDAKVKAITTLRNDLITYILHVVKTNNVMLKDDVNRLLFDSENSIAHRLIKFSRDPRTKDNLIFRRLIPVFKDEDSDWVNNVEMFNQLITGMDADIYADEWEKLLDNDPDISNFAYDLITTLILQSGLSNNYKSYKSIISNKAFLNHIMPIISNLIDNKYTIDMDLFTELWHRQRSILNNPTITPTININTGAYNQYASENMSNSIYANETGLTINSVTRHEITNEKGQSIVISKPNKTFDYYGGFDYIKVVQLVEDEEGNVRSSIRYYKYNTDIIDKDGVTLLSKYYERTSPLGIKNKFFEFYTQDEFEKNKGLSKLSSNTGITSNENRITEPSFLEDLVDENGKVVTPEPIDETELNDPELQDYYSEDNDQDDQLPGEDYEGTEPTEQEMNALKDNPFYQSFASKNTSDSNNAEDQWKKYGTQLIEKSKGESFPMTKATWMETSEEQRKKTIDCL